MIEIKPNGKIFFQSRCVGQLYIINNNWFLSHNGLGLFSGQRDKLVEMVLRFHWGE